MFTILKTDYLNAVSYTKVTCGFILQENIKKLSELNTFNLVSKFNEFEPRLKYAKNWFQVSAGLNLEKFKWNKQNLSRGLNLNRSSNSLNSLRELLQPPLCTPTSVRWS